MRDHPFIRSAGTWLFRLAIVLACLPAETTVLVIAVLGSRGGQ